MGVITYPYLWQAYTNHEETHISITHMSPRMAWGGSPCNVNPRAALGLRPGYEIRCYFVTTSLNGMGASLESALNSPSIPKMQYVPVVYNHICTCWVTCYYVVNQDILQFICGMSVLLLWYLVYHGANKRDIQRSRVDEWARDIQKMLHITATYYISLSCGIFWYKNLHYSIYME